jgi:hypothetical protein
VTASDDFIDQASEAETFQGRFDLCCAAYYSSKKMVRIATNSIDFFVIGCALKTNNEVHSKICEIDTQFNKVNLRRK